MKAKPIIAVTMGDPGGIGPEIILKTIREIKFDGSFYFLLIGSQAVFQFASERFGIPFRFNPIPTLEPAFMRDDSVNMLDISDEADVLYEKINGSNRRTEDVFSIGEVSLLNASLAFTALKVAAFQASCGLVSAIVTAPIHKEAMRLVDPKFSGHTEYLAKISKTKEFAMSFYSPHFCVTLATIHVPLKRVSAHLKTPEILSKIMLTDVFLKKNLGIPHPKLAVAALNPHGSEFGDEEEEVIVPAVKEARKRGASVEGPLPGDQVFYDAFNKRFHAVIAMYHDQGLAPFKMLAFDTGVNVTLGLPFIRTSPDHGTAFDIAYQNKARHLSFQQSFKLVLDCTK